MECVINFFKQLGFSLDKIQRTDRFYMDKFYPVHIDVQGDRDNITIRLIGYKHVEEEHDFSTDRLNDVEEVIKYWEKH